MKRIRLGINIDHVATLRQARGTRYPDPVHAAMLAVQAGADGITLHLREDRRHIQERDVDLLKQQLTVPMNLEMAATNEMVDIACEYRPEHVCLVPEKREELTTEGGLDVISNEERLTQVCRQLAAEGIEVSLFIDPDIDQITAAIRTGSPVIELHTGCYADASGHQQQRELAHLQLAAEFAQQQDIIVNAGHGLHNHNVIPIAAIPQINELNIGHAIIAHAIFVGLPQAVKEMRDLIDQARK